MQAVMETAFDIVYLSTVITLGIIMIVKSRSNKQRLLFGIMAVVLGSGDAFHLIPRSYALCTDGLSAHAEALGIGKLVTSITMTIFYIILYHIWELRYEIKNKMYRIIMYSLAGLRIILCCFPQNEWLNADAPISWGIIRNIPFAIMGIITIVLFFKEAKNDKAFKYMWIAVTLSFALYIPVVLFADAYPLIGMLMIPKTCAYVWIILMGFTDMVKEGKTIEKIS